MQKILLLFSEQGCVKQMQKTAFTLWFVLAHPQRAEAL
jgi:hypothetical protein